MSTVRRLLFPSKVLSEISSHQGLAQKYGREPPRKPTRYSYPNAPGSSRRFLTLGFTDWWRPCRGFPARLKFVSGATDFQNFQCFQHPNLSLRAKLLGKNRDGRFSVWGKVGKGNHPFEVSRLHCQIWSEMPCLKPLVPTWLNAKDLEVGKAAAKTTIERDLLPLASSFARHVTKATACGWRLLQLWFEKTGVMKGIEGFPNKNTKHGETMWKLPRNPWNFVILPGAWAAETGNCTKSCSGRLGDWPLGLDWWFSIKHLTLANG